VSYLAEKIEARLRSIHERLSTIDEMRARCQFILESGLAKEVMGVKVHKLVAQYSTLIASQANLVKVEADYITKLMRDLDDNESGTSVPSG